MTIAFMWEPADLIAAGGAARIAAARETGPFARLDPETLDCVFARRSIVGVDC